MNRASFRSVLLTLIFALSLISIGGMGWFFIRLFTQDRTQTLLESEASNTRRLAAHILNLVSLAELTESQRVVDSKEIIFVIENACREEEGARKVLVSRYFEGHLQTIGADPLQWRNGLDVYRACMAMRYPPQGTVAKKHVYFQSGAQILVPYLLVLINRGEGQARLAMLSLDGYRSVTRNTAFVAGRNGSPIWAADGKTYLDGAMADTLVDPPGLARIVTLALKGGGTAVSPIGVNAWISYSPLADEEALLSLSYAPELLRPVYFAGSQMGLLLAGFLFLCLFAGKVIASKLSRPFAELISYADSVGDGDFSKRFEETGIVEFARLKSAFNVMSEKIGMLIDETRQKAAMEREVILAQGVQKMLLPPQNVELARHRLNGIMKAAHYVGGDWWGVREIERVGKSPLVLVCVGDATDHGVSPALVAATVKGAHTVLSDLLTERFKAGEQAAIDPRHVLRAFHRTIWDAAQGTISMTMILAVLDIDEGRLVLANAGHVNPFLLPSGEGGRMVGGTGSSLGVDAADISVEVEEFPWKAGDRILFYTDGLIENYREDTNVFSRKSLSKLLKNVTHGGARDLMRRIMQVWTQEAKGIPQADDVTIVVCEAKLEEKGDNAV